MKYKVGDKVRIKDNNWYWSNCDILGNIECGEWHVGSNSTVLTDEDRKHYKDMLHIENKLKLI